MYLKEHKLKWDQLHESVRFQPKYPNESVIRFVKMNFPDSKETKIMDLGCGAGRHVVFLASEGYSVTGVDLSKTGLDRTGVWLKAAGLHAELVEATVTDLPIPSDSFDGVISYGVILYLSFDDIKRAISEIHRVLKTGGKAFVMVRSTKDMRFGEGTEIESNTFKIQGNDTNEEGMIMHFFTEDEIRELFHMFIEIKIGFVSMSMDSLEHVNVDYLIHLTK